MAKDSFDLVVLGSGPAGQRAAIQATKLGKKVAVVERSFDVGGVCINTGTVPSKTLREAVLDLSGARERALYGLIVRAQDELTAEKLLMRAHRVMSIERQVIEAQLARNRVKLFRGAGRFDGPNVICIDGPDGVQRLNTEFVVIAVGTVPGIPPGIAVDHQRVLTSDDILSLRQVPRRMAIIGAGVIGTEYATIFATLGVDVVLTDRQRELLSMVDREVVDVFSTQIRELGVTLRLGEEVDHIEGQGDAPRVVFTKSGKRIVADLVLVSAGRQGATHGLGLETAGLTADARGRIVVDESYRTSVPSIYAVGDVIGAPQLASTSAEQGRFAACHAFGIETGYLPELFPYGIYAIPEIAWVGRNEADLTAAGIPYETGHARYKEIARGHILGDSNGLLKLIFQPDTRELLGVWIVGTQATELVHIGQAAMALGGGLDYFVRGVFNYPTLAECYKVAALDGNNRLRAAKTVPRETGGPA